MQGLKHCWQSRWFIPRVLESQRQPVWLVVTI